MVFIDPVKDNVINTITSGFGSAVEKFYIINEEIIIVESFTGIHKLMF